MAIDERRQKAIELALKQIDKTFGKGALVRLGDKQVEKIESKTKKEFQYIYSEINSLKIVVRFLFFISLILLILFIVSLIFIIFVLKYKNII